MDLFPSLFVIGGNLGLNFMRSESNIFNEELKDIAAPWKVRCVATSGTNKPILLLILAKSRLRCRQ